MVDGTFLICLSECVRFGVDSISVVDFGDAVEFDLEFLKRFDDSVLRFHEHDSFALFSSDFAGSLYVNEFFSGDEIAFPKNSFECHSFGTVVDYECFDDAFLSDEHSPEVKVIGLVVLIIDDVSGVIHRRSVDIDGIFDEDSF